MSWRDKILSASFRDVPFKVLDTTTEIGRKTVLHQFPFKDVPVVEDLGRDSRRFNIVGYIIQSKDNKFDYFVERDALIAELEKKGPGELKHPFLGIQTVSLVGRAEIGESFSQGGIARFTMSFVLTADKFLFPSTVIDSEQAVDEIVKTGKEQLQEGFTEKYLPSGMGDSGLLKMTNAVRSYAAMAKSGVSGIRAAAGAKIAVALGLLSEIESTVASVIHLPSDLMTTIENGFNGLEGIVGLFEGDFQYVVGFDPEEEIADILIDATVDAAVDLASFGLQANGTETGGDGTVFPPSPLGGSVEVINVVTATTARQAANRIAITNYVRARFLLLACKIAVRRNYDSYEQAIAVMNKIVIALSAQILKLGNEVTSNIFSEYDIVVADETSYMVLEQVRPVFIKVMRELGASLARIVDYNLASGVLSTLELAYNRYEDLDRAEGIFERNQPVINHPGFLTGRASIEILSE